MFTQKPYESLTIRDNFMFGKISQDPANAQIILSALLNREISINHAAMEHHIQLLKTKKHVRLDLFAEDNLRNKYDAEMQNQNTNTKKKKELPKRSRYYQCMLDGQILDTGCNYIEMNDTYIIFICEFDPFNQDLYQYTFVHSCLENDTLKLNDGTTCIFFNLSADFSNAPETTQNMLLYLATGVISNEDTKKIDKAVNIAKEKEEWREEYMLTFVHDKDMYNAGHIDGEISGIQKITFKYIQNGDLSLKAGASELNISTDELIKLMNNAGYDIKND